MTKQEAAHLIKFLDVSFPNKKEINIAALSEVWATIFFEEPYELMKAVVKIIVTTATFFPSISELQKTLNALSDEFNCIPIAEEAWLEVRKNLSVLRKPTFSHPLIEKTVECMGFYELSNSENPSIDRAQFIKIFNNFKIREHEKNINKNVFLELNLESIIIKKDVNFLLSQNKLQ